MYKRGTSLPHTSVLPPSTSLHSGPGSSSHQTRWHHDSHLIAAVSGWTGTLLHDTASKVALAHQCSPRTSAEGREGEGTVFTGFQTEMLCKLGECTALWGERERGSVVGIHVTSHCKLIVTEMHIACCRSPQLLSLSAGRAHAMCRFRLIRCPSFGSRIEGGELGFN